MKKILILCGLLFFVLCNGMKISKQVSNEQFGQAVSRLDMAEIRNALEQGADPSLTPGLLCDVLEKKVTFAKGQEKQQNEYEKNRNQVVALLIDNPRTHLNCRNSAGETPLMHFVRRKNRFDAQKLLQTGRVEINAKNGSGQTALNLVTNQEMKELLLAYGALSGAPAAAQPAIQWVAPLTPARPGAVPAAAQPALRAMPVPGSMAPRSAPIANAQTPEPSLAQQQLQKQFFNAIKAGNIDEVNRLLATGAIDVNAFDADRRTPLYWAIKNGSLPIVTRLLQVSSLRINDPIDPIDNKGYTYLMFAMPTKNPEIIAEFLKRQDIKINLVSQDGVTALDFATVIKPVNVAVEITTMLLNRGARTGAALYKDKQRQLQSTMILPPAAAQPTAVPPMQMLPSPQIPAAAQAGLLQLPAQQPMVGTKRKAVEPAQPAPLPPMQVLQSPVPVAAQPMVPGTRIPQMREEEGSTSEEEPVIRITPKSARQE